MRNVLVVDDSPVDRRLVAGLLESDPTLRIVVAEDGREAMERLRESPIDLVVTDMQMPELDGLGLVRQIRVDQPHVPVILITAHGSERLALEALQQGAASYVPKSQLAEMLEESVAQVLSLTTADRTYERLSTCQTHAEFSFALDNDPALIDPLVDLVQQIVFAMELCDATGKYRTGMALQQALQNALLHGNLEVPADKLGQARDELMNEDGAGFLADRRKHMPYRERRIVAQVQITREQAQLRRSGRGTGIRREEVSDRLSGGGGAARRARFAIDADVHGRRSIQRSRQRSHDDQAQ